MMLRRLGVIAVFAFAGYAFWTVVKLSMQGEVRAPAPRPVAFEVLSRGNGAEPDSLDPQLARMDSALTILRDCYEGLAGLDRDAKVVPGVAASWRVSDDGLRYTFKLRAAARWSNAEPVTATDFVFAWRRLVDPATASQYASLLEPVRNAAAITARRAAADTLGVRAVDPTTLEVELERPTAYFPALLSHPATFPVHRPTLAARPRDFARPGIAVTNGAYVPTEWRIGSHVLARRNPYYRDRARVAIDVVRYNHVADVATELKRYRAGEIDVTYTIPPGQVARLARELGAEVHTGPQLGTYYYGLAVDRAPFRDARPLRQALAMTIDRAVLTDKLLGGGERPAHGFVPPGVDGYRGAEFGWARLAWPERLALARRLYAEAGYSASRPLRITLRYNKSPLHDDLAIAVAAMWKQYLGVETRLHPEEYRALKQAIDNREARVFRASWIGDYNDAYSFLQVLQSDFGINLPRYASAQYDALLAEARAARDPATRAGLLRAAEARLLDDVPLIPVYFYAAQHLVKPHVRGWYDNVMNVTYSKDLSIVMPQVPDGV
jgi:oligopeptide transport system substrate-binding protein